MQEVPIVLGFTAGELSPWLSTRFDLQAYQRGAANITNFQVIPYGGIQFRPGTEYVGWAHSTDSRLFPFYYAENDILMLEFSAEGMRVYRDGAPVTKEDGSVYTLSSPWYTEAQVKRLQFTQVNDAVYVCSPDFMPTVLYRYADNQWEWQTISFDAYPRETHAAQEGTLSVLFEQGGLYANLTINGGEQRFSADMVNRECLLADANIPAKTLFANEVQYISAIDAPNLSTTGVSRHTILKQHDAASGMYYFYHCIRDYSPTAYNGSLLLSDYPHFFLPGIMRLDSSYTPYEISRDWEVSTTGTWNAHWEIWRSYDTPDIEPDFRRWNWECIKTFSQSDYETRQNWALSGSESRPCRMVLVCRCCSSAEVLGAVVQFKVLGGTREYKMLITSVSDATHARARVLRTYMGSPTSFSTRSWSFGAIGPRNGYPAFSAMYQGRLWLGGMQGLPTTLLASVIDDFHNFRMGSNDDDSLHLNIVDSDQSRICWLSPARQLLVGTSDSEWVVGSSTGGALTPTTVMLRRQSSVGSENTPAKSVENTVLFVQRGGRRIREIAYRLESDGFAATDISMLAEHLFTAGIKDWCVQRGPDFNVWVLMNDGSLARLTINMNQQVTAWQRVQMDGRKVLNIAALPSLAGNAEDEVWFVSQIQTTGKAVLERMRADSPHMDCCEEVVSVKPMELACGYHLHGIEIRVVDVDSGEAVRCMGYAGGLRALPNVVAGRRYRVGIPIVATLQTMPLEGGASFNSVRQFCRFRLRLLESDTDFEFRSTANNRWERHVLNEDTSTAQPYTGALRLAQMPDAGVGQSLCIRYSGRHDFRLLSITQEVDFHAK